MKLKMPFNELKDAIEGASHERRYFIDKKSHRILFISEYEEDYQRKMGEVENDNFIAIQPRMPVDDFEMMQSFVYMLSDFGLAQEFHEALNRRAPFMNFKELLDKRSELLEQWHNHRDNEIKNEAMNFLCENEIELADNSFMPKIEIRELKPDEVNLPEGFEGFGPIECMECRNKEGIRTRYFELSHSAENMLIGREIKRMMKKNFGIEDYGHIGGGDKEILTSSECPNCKSKEVFEDF